MNNTSQISKSNKKNTCNFGSWQCKEQKTKPQNPFTIQKPHRKMRLMATDEQNPDHKPSRPPQKIHSPINKFPTRTRERILIIRSKQDPDHKPPNLVKKNKTQLKRQPNSTSTDRRRIRTTPTKRQKP